MRSCPAADEVVRIALQLDSEGSYELSPQTRHTLRRLSASINEDGADSEQVENQLALVLEAVPEVAVDEGVVERQLEALTQ